MGVADHILLNMRLFTTRNKAIKTLEKIDQAIKVYQAIKFLDHHRRWKYRAHSSDYPLDDDNKQQQTDRPITLPD